MVRLLGTPSIERDGLPVASPRGQKAWAVLGYVVSSNRGVSRQHLAELLFGEADDPMGALRWVLSETRRAVGAPESLRGDPLRWSSVDVRVDVLDIAAGDEEAVVAATGEFLEGVYVDGCAAFESWLAAERYRWAAEQEARVRQTAAAAFAEGRLTDAARLAARAVRLNTLDEGNHELLVRCLMALGDRTAALRQIAVCEDVFRRELGRTPSPALRAATDHARLPAAPVEHSLGEAEIQLDVGRAAVNAGATRAGVEALYRAVALTEDGPDRHLHARALLALGGALVHAVRGRDGEGSTTLHRALHAAREVGDRETAMTACRELGFVEVQAGRRPTATEWLQRAVDLAETDGELGSALAIQGMSAGDIGRHAEAAELLTRSAELAEASGELRQQAWSLGVLCRSLMLRGDDAEALLAADQSIDLCRSQRWMVFLPWPRAFRAELHLRAGRSDLARQEIEPAWSLSCQLGDPCWEGVSARMLARLSAHDGDLVAAHTWLDEARRRCDAVADTYQWVRAYVIDAQIDLAVARGDDHAALVLADELAALAARSEMFEFVVHAHLHRARLGRPNALASARLLAGHVENPALDRTVRDMSNRPDVETDPA